VHFLFAWRYFRGKYSYQAVQIIAWVSVVAIAIGTAALITILSVSNGFTEIVKGLYADFYADIRVAPKNGKYFSLDTTQYHSISAIKGVNAYSRIVESKALLVNGNFQTVALIKGVDTTYGKINSIHKYIKRGQTTIGNIEHPMLVMGVGVEQKLGIYHSMNTDTIQLYAVNRSGQKLTSLNQLNNLAAAKSGVFSVQQDFDDQYVFTNVGFAQYLFDAQPNEYTAIELAIDKQSETEVVHALQKIIGNQFDIKNKFQQNADLYKIMSVEKWIIFAILAIIMIVASFNLIGAVTMVVLEKSKDIHVLHAMGATPWDIQKIFLLLSVVMAFVGALLGGGLATAFCQLQDKLHLIKLEGDSFVIDYYPIKMEGADVMAIVSLVACIALLAGWIPAKNASKKMFEKIEN
jgi:lipoprotein-releasing system permease protein